METGKVLVIEPPYQGEQRYPWNEDTAERFDLDRFAIKELENGDTYWDGDNVAYSLEDAEEG